MATQVETAIAKAESLLGSHAYDNYCQRFVRVCYEAAGIYGSASSAREACNKWKVSSSKTDIPTGAAVYFFNSSDGHVGIYIGSSQMIHAWGSAGVIKSNISICSNYQGWGWQGGVKPSGAGESVSSSSSSSSGSSKKSSSVDLCSTSVISTVSVGGSLNGSAYYSIQSDGTNRYEMHIINNGIDYQPVLTDEVTWTTEWKDTAGKLEFSILKDENINIQEGNKVEFFYNGTGVFYGYLFTKSRTKNGIIECRAYDQLRYLKNKDTYCYTKKTLGEVIIMIAADYQLNVDQSKIADTGYVIPGRVEDDQTLFDIIKNARDLTENATGKMYIFYDDFGLLSLKSIEDLATDYLIDEETAEDFDYKTSVDDDVYNQIQFYRDDSETGNRGKYIYKDNDLINQWGILQLSCKLEDGDNPETFGSTVLKLYSQKKRKLTVNDCIGDTRLRAGSTAFITLNVGDVSYENAAVIVTKAVHRFGKKYSCDLTLLGGSAYLDEG
ncbi:MAG: C40 family peptidase [Clostridiales bacterium]|nr:C40 family peptidase [Clostridiales bacterium]